MAEETSIEPPVAHRSRPALAALLTGAMAISFAPVFIRTSQTGPVSTAFWRLALAGPFFWFWMVRARRRPGVPRAAPPSVRRILLLMVPGLFFAGDLALWHWSVVLTSAANATLFVNLAPIFVTLVCWLWLGERFTWVFVMGLIVAMGAAAFMVGSSAEGGDSSLLGDTLATVAAVFYAGYLVAVKLLRARLAVRDIMAWSCLSSSAVFLVVALVSGEQLMPTTALGWLPLLGLALVCQIWGQGLIAYALAHLPASFSSVTLLVQPVAATVLARVFLGEGIGAVQAVAGPVVLAGILLAKHGSRVE